MPLLNDAQGVYFGDTPAQAVYLGDTLVWSAVPKPPPLTIPGLTLWTDAQQQVDSDGATVTVIRDFSPDDRVITPQVGPVYRANVGGLPGMEWIPGNQGAMAGNWNAGTEGLTFVFVGQHYPGGSYPMMLVHGTDGDGIEMRHQGVSQEIVIRYTSHGIVYTNGANTAAGTGIDHIWALRIGRQESNAWSDAAKVTGGTCTMMNQALMLYLCRREGGYPFIGLMREALVYAGPVSDTDMQVLFDYLTTKWQLTRG